MEYYGNVFRPPSEAYSLILQATIGCSHNKCTYCNMYRGEKFIIRKKADLYKDIAEVAFYNPNIKKVFLADGDALMIKTEDLSEILDKLYETFPKLNHVGIYASPKSVLIKTPQELKLLKSKGLTIAYLGVETGSDKVLKDVNKGVGSVEMTKSAIMLKQAGITLSIMILIGIGGREDSAEHIRGTVELINNVSPDYLSFLTLMIPEDTELYKKVIRGEFTPLDPFEGIYEIRNIMAGLEVKNKVIVRSNHASNYINLRGSLPEDKKAMLSALDEALNHRDSYESVIAYKNLHRGF